ncbi:hypothetical protein EJ06DRAFT_399088 [Trichodelitschia bisporula]|uniref:Uncharacterized protein n=1 Tax=Trichodelitschia bisporula TaxID=703511 RepID=A0A6G1HX53_9PEZI|nr:hypothetical protein EJ06DRAFT_399088 [Trichodelitschia bisporula]
MGQVPIHFAGDVRGGIKLSAGGSSFGLHWIVILHMEPYDVLHARIFVSITIRPRISIFGPRPPSQPRAESNPPTGHSLKRGLPISTRPRFICPVPPSTTHVSPAIPSPDKPRSTKPVVPEAHSRCATPTPSRLPRGGPNRLLHHSRSAVFRRTGSVCPTPIDGTLTLTCTPFVPHLRGTLRGKFEIGGVDCAVGGGSVDSHSLWEAAWSVSARPFYLGGKFPITHFSQQNFTSKRRAGTCFASREYTRQVPSLLCIIPSHTKLEYHE